MSDIDHLVVDIAKKAKTASYKLTSLSSEQRNSALLAIAGALNEHRSIIKAENAKDIKKGTELGLSKALLDRLLLSDRIIDEMILGVKNIANMKDPVGELISSSKLANGMDLKKMRVPLGVVGIIFESRPNVVVDVAALCLKSANAAILRGGKEAEHSNRALMNAINDGLTKISFVPFAVQLIDVTDRKAVEILCRLNQWVDVIIPRGGESLIKAVSDVATVPVIRHYKGVCHVYVDKSADFSMALKICHNAKCSRPSVCNAIEKILVHKDIAKDFLPKLYDLFMSAGVEMRADEATRAICPQIMAAQMSDWSEEYLDLIIAIKIVSDVYEAIYHINTFGSHHSDAIISNDPQTADAFVKGTDSAAVYVNASTRFTDGGMFGLGAEMGISTDKLHARGPMGIMELTTYKWVGVGTGQIRE